MLTERNILPGYYIGLIIENQYDFETRTYSRYPHNIELIIQVVNTLPKENKYFEYPFFQYPKNVLLDMVEGDNRTVEANIDRSLVDDGSKDKIFVDGLEFKLDTDPDQPIAVFLFGLKYRDKNGVVSTLMSKSTTYFRYLEPDENFISLPIKVKKKREPEPSPYPDIPGIKPHPGPNPEYPGDKPDEPGKLYIDDSKKKEQLNNNDTWQDTGIVLGNYESNKDKYKITWCKDINNKDVDTEVRNDHLWLYVRKESTDIIMISITCSGIPDGSKDIRIDLPPLKPDYNPFFPTYNGN